MKAFLWSVALCAVGALAMPGLKQELGKVSLDGSCGAENGYTCLGSFLGGCCSEAGHCGSTNIFCGQGCQSEYGHCTGTVNGLAISNDGTCGRGKTCQGSVYGDCCSEHGFCGSTSEYCSAGCDSSFGLCGAAASSSTSATSYSSGTAASTSSAAVATSTNPTCPASNGTEFIATSGAVFLIECYIDRVGNDLTPIFIRSNKIADCINHCDATSGCVDISMVGEACYRKSEANSFYVDSQLIRGARMISAAPSGSSSSSIASSISTSSVVSAVPTESASSTSSYTFKTESSTIISSSTFLVSAAASTGVSTEIFTEASTGVSTGVSTEVSREVSTGVSREVSTSVNSTTSLSISVSPTTAPSTSIPSSGSTIPTSNSTGVYNSSTTLLNSTTSAPSTTTYAFAAGGISSGHPVVTNTTGCSTKPTSTASCTPCEGQPGNDKFCGYTAYDNARDDMPITCNTVEYTLDLTECTVSPDGFKRNALCINGQTPGPLIEANWGDTIVVHVTNSMSTNGTSIHWHGSRQNYTNEMDGVVSITQCALAPGQSQTFTFKAGNYGFSWYHSHLSLQAYQGLFGPMRIHGPVTKSYDEDAGNLIVQDWSHVSVEEMYIPAENAGVRTMDTGLINGMNVWGKDGTANQTGQRYTVPKTFVPGQSYLFSIVNTAIQSTYKFYIDSHTLTVIGIDYVPIVPYNTTVLNINVGQRYQVIVTANQRIGDYWLRFDNQNACATTIKSDDIKGIIHYSGSPGRLPNSTAYNYTRKYEKGQILGECVDELSSNLVPAYPINVGTKTDEVDESVAISNANSAHLYRWYLSGAPFQANWADATLYDIYNNNTVPNYSGRLAIDVPKLGEWVYVVIESPVPLGHPIHLHGHDFHILASGYGSYNSSVELNLTNPPRRDTAFMPGDGPTGKGGYLVLAYYTDNPGAWLMHCHIGWHVAMGFALQFIEAKDLIRDTISDSCTLNNVCTTWRDWAGQHNITTDDAGV